MVVLIYTRNNFSPGKVPDENRKERSLRVLTVFTEMNDLASNNLLFCQLFYTERKGSPSTVTVNSCAPVK